MNQPPRLLLVDDDDNILNLSRHILEPVGYETHTASSIATADALMRANGPGYFSSVILDWNLPGEDGLDFLIQLKSQDDTKYIPVVMLTARTDDEDIRRGIEAGAFYYHPKPPDKQMLRSMVAKAVERFKRVSELQFDVSDGLSITDQVESARLRFQRMRDADAIARWLAQMYPDPPLARIGVHELLVNAVEHGNLGISFHEKADLIARGEHAREIERRLASAEYSEKWVAVDFSRKGNLLHLRVEDQGAGFDFERYMELDPERAFAAHGRGIAMARQLTFESIEYDPPGNAVNAYLELEDS